MYSEDSMLAHDRTDEEEPLEVNQISQVSDRSAKFYGHGPNDIYTIIEEDGESGSYHSKLRQ